MNKFKHLLGDNLKNREWSIIRGALKNDFIEIEKALAEDPDSINDQDENLGVTALHIAAGDGNASLVKFLCEQPGCDALIADRLGRPANYMASVIGREDIANMINEFMRASCPPITYEDVEESEDIQALADRNVIISFKPRGP